MCGGATTGEDSSLLMLGSVVNIVTNKGLVSLCFNIVTSQCNDILHIK